MSRPDAIVIGAGVNGLVAACALGRAGKRVVVLEATAHIGGLAASVEFHPGYRSGGVLHDTSMVRPRLIRELELERYDLALRASPPPTLACGDGETLDLRALPDAEEKELGALREFLGRLRPVLAGFSDQPPIDVLDLESESKLELVKRGLKLRRLGKRDMLELMRIAPMCVADFLEEWIASPLLQAALALPSMTASYAAPRSPGTTANFLLLHAMTGPGTASGSHQLVAALERAARDVGVEIRTECAAAAIEVEDRSATGVTLANGDGLEADWVFAACDPRTALLDLVAPRHLTARLEDRLAAYRSRGTTAQLLLALEAPAVFAGHDGVEFARVATDLIDIERAFDPIKYGEIPARPVLDVAVPSVADPTLCPEGHAVISILAHYAPPHPKGGWSDEARQTLTERIIDRLAEHVPTVRDHIVSAALSTPADLERDWRLTGGNLHHGERAIDQLLVRPVPECSGHQTPIAGLVLCGGGTHPGGGLHGGCGLLAADTVS